MKRLSLIFINILFLFTGINGQSSLQNNTRITEILNQFPAQDNADFEKVMTEMNSLGPNGLWELTTGMIPFGKGDNSKYQYAVMGYTSYASAPGRLSQKNNAETAWIRALGNTQDKNLTSFFMDMLEIIGSDRAVPAVSKYLTDDTLGLKAAPVLAAIHSPLAGSTLLRALQEQGTPKAAILQALGNMKYLPALNQISAFVLSESQQQKEAALYALAEIADPVSEGILMAQTSVNGKNFENPEATARYEQFIRNLNKNGHANEARELAAAFVKNTKKSNTYSRIAALNAMVFTTKEQSLNDLVKAAYDKNPEYRETALSLAAPYINSSNISLFTKGLKKAPDDVKISIVNLVASHPDQRVTGELLKYAQGSQNPDLKHAAILALAQFGTTGTAADLLKILEKSNEQDANVIGEALQLANDNNLIPGVLSQLQKSNGFQKAVLLNVLGSKRANEGFDEVVASLASSDEGIRTAALTALPEVSAPGNIGKLFSLLQSSSGQDEIQSIQNAVKVSLAGVPDKENTVLQQLNQVPQNRQYLLFPALSDLGTRSALERVYAAYKNNTGGKATDALAALAVWPETNAMDNLFSIAVSDPGSENRNTALGGYIRLIQQANVPAAEKLLWLKKAASVASNKELKGKIIDQVSQINTFPALAFAASFLDDASVSQKAAGAVMNIGLSDKSFYGTTVRQWLNKAMNTIKGQDDVYMKKSIQKFLDDMPQKEGFVSLFNGKDLSGWKGLVANPIQRSKMTTQELQTAQEKADSVMRAGWVVKDGDLIFLGKGDNIATVRQYGNFEMLIDWKIFDDGNKNGDAGIYLRGTPQVQIWDTSRTNVGAQVGSGGLYNNQKHRSTPLKVADNKLGEWNHFDIRMVNDTVTVYLNGELVTDHVPLENYWDRNMPLWPEEQIELQAHGSRIGYRDIYIKELSNNKPFQLSEEEKSEGFQVLFDGTNMDNWQGNLIDYVLENGQIVIRPQPGQRKTRNLYTKNEYKDFDFRFEFKLTPGANNGVGIRAPLEGDAAYAGMEIQILDNTSDRYKDIKPYQFHGSVYGVIPAKKGFLRPVGEWNYEEIIARGPNIKVILNGKTIVDGNIKTASRNGTMDKREHPGLLNEKGHIGFLGHGEVVHFRNIRIKEL